MGGPATAQAAWVSRLYRALHRDQVPSILFQPTPMATTRRRTCSADNETFRERDMVARAAKKVYDQVKASAAPDTPIIWSEYNATYMNQPEVTDSAFMGPWLANNIRECDGLTTMMSYWCFSDVFEEQGVVKTPFYGGYGLIAERTFRKSVSRLRSAARAGQSPSDGRFGKRAGDGAGRWDARDRFVELCGAGSKRVPAKTFRLTVKGVTRGTIGFGLLIPTHGSARKPGRIWAARSVRLRRRPR